MKARLFDNLPPPQEELIFKVFESGFDDQIMVNLVTREGKFIQHVFSFGQSGITKYWIDPVANVPFRLDDDTIAVE